MPVMYHWTWVSAMAVLKWGLVVGRQDQVQDLSRYGWVVVGSFHKCVVIPVWVVAPQTVSRRTMSDAEQVDLAPHCGSSAGLAPGGVPGTMGPRISEHHLDEHSDLQT